ncbi:putative membrane protein [Spirosoma lacussanchae]|uniref:YMGG-like glycine zipper-containing protein n=1 Tax=Spirosoma lacussanchae TaxID=1884249 RepID=UPI001109F9EA|nr:YMGG-like glycine zipper-containing protein [Spirosoma lacussanchae]
MKTNRAIILMAVLTAFIFSHVVEAQQRRKWSPQAKGTAIGAGVGGAAGAIINKRNRLVGGLIGGAAGAAGGYAIGKGVDNRRKTNARIAAAERQAAEARREAALARREAAAAADKPGVVTRPAAERVAAVQKAPVPAVAGVAAGAGMAATAFSAQTLSEPYQNNTLFLLNNNYGDQNSAYPSSEVRRKSW